LGKGREANAGRRSKRPSHHRERGKEQNKKKKKKIRGGKELKRLGVQHKRPGKKGTRKLMRGRGGSYSTEEEGCLHVGYGKKKKKTTTAAKSSEGILGGVRMRGRRNSVSLDGGKELKSKRAEKRKRGGGQTRRVTTAEGVGCGTVVEGGPRPLQRKGGGEPRCACSQPEVREKSCEKKKLGCAR